MQNTDKLSFFLLFMLYVDAPQDPQGEGGEACKIIDIADDQDDDDSGNKPVRNLPEGCVIVEMDDVSYLRDSNSCQPMYQDCKPVWYTGRSVSAEDREFRNAVTQSQKSG